MALSPGLNDGEVWSSTAKRKSQGLRGTVEKSVDGQGWGARGHVNP